MADAGQPAAGERTTRLRSALRQGAHLSHWVWLPARTNHDFGEEKAGEATSSRQSAPPRCEVHALALFPQVKKLIYFLAQNGLVSGQVRHRSPC